MSVSEVVMFVVAVSLFSVFFFKGPNCVYYPIHP